ncbi:MAG TPA: TIR domain-containing protein [Sphingomicrobium sp.]|nr:TIR domain-containing protein [Sphingomicrobium sp.]
MADVFLSYARPNARAAEMIAGALREAGLSVWYDERLPAHRAYADVIEEELDTARAVMVLWSDEAVRSQWVRSEANRARETGRLVQARLDQARLPMPFDQIQCADLGNWRGDVDAPAWRSLAASLFELTGKAEPVRTRAGHRVGPWARPGISRRALVASGAAVAAVGTAGGVLWLRPRAPKVPPKAEQLRQSAMTIMADGRPEEQDQAIAYLLEATEIAPDFASAWGSLAMAYALRKYQLPLAERAGSEERCRSAARKSRELDPDEPLGECALALLVPAYRHWAEVGRLGRTLTKRHPGIPVAQHILADSMTDAGQWKDAIKVHDRIDRERFVIPLSDRSIIQALWAGGELQRAETMLDGATERWPRHRAIYNMRAEFLMHSGRANEAIQQLENQSLRPPAYPQDLLDGALAMARAMAGTLPPAAALAANLDMLGTATADYLTYLNHKIATVQIVAQRAVALGDNRTALELLDGYYFGSGRWAKVAPAAGDDDRNTICLFEPPMRGIWRDPGFADLLRRVGLEDHWRRSRAVPDFRLA